MARTSTSINSAAAPAAMQPGESLLAKARRLRPLIDRMGAANEELGALTGEVVDALHEGGFFAMWMPDAMGGTELRPTPSLDVLEEISYADGSTGWVVMAAAVATATGAAYIGEESVKRIFSGKRVPVIAGQGSPGGRAVVTDGGFMLSGKWNYGSGLKHADYIHSGALVIEKNGQPRLGKGGMPEPRVMVVPRDQVQFGDNWDVMGLRGTGSIDYSCENVFVPEHATHITDTVEPKRGGHFFRLGIRGMSSICHTGFTLGVGRRILDETAILAQNKAGRFGKLGDSESFLEKFAGAEAKFRAARAFAYETWRDVEDTLYCGDPLTQRQWTLIRLSLNHITWTTADVCSFAYYAGGGVSLRESTLQRCFRDMHAATQHATSAVPILIDCGRELSGMAKDKVWGFMGLVNPA